MLMPNIQTTNINRGYLKKIGMNTLTNLKSYNAVDVKFTDTMMVVSIEDGRELSIPLEWFSRLRNASSDNLKKWRFIGDGEGIRWDDLDEDILVENLLS